MPLINVTNLPRCQKKSKITWTVFCLHDWLLSNKLSHRDIMTPQLKTGGKSLSDVALTTQVLKQYLLGPWLDGKNFPPYIKDKARTVFASHDSYRKLYAPHEGTVDTTWLFQWPESGRKLMAFLEGAIYAPSPQEETLYRMAVKNNNTPEEIMSWNPFASLVNDLNDEVMLVFLHSMSITCPYIYICVYIYIYMYIYAAGVAWIHA